MKKILIIISGIILMSALSEASFGNFNFGLADGSANFTGIYNTTSFYIEGALRLGGNQNSSNKWVGNGILFAGNQSGLFYIRFYDILNPSDPGLDWVGTYNQTHWEMSRMNNNNITLRGVVYEGIL